MTSGAPATRAHALLADLVATSRDVRDASRRLDKTGRLAAFLRRIGADDIEIAVAFLCGGLPQGRIGVGFAALSEVRSTPPTSSPGLTLGEVDKVFEKVAGTRGRGSMAARVEQLRDMLGRATRDEQDFLVRLLHGEIRQGALESVITDAVARAAGLPAARVRRAVMMAGGLGPVARVALGETAPDLSRFSLRVFHPVQPMLAQSADGVDDALARLGAMALDYKLDGARVQVHKDGTEVRVFTRHLRDVTAAVPEVVETAGAMPPRRLILDGEVLALGADGTPLPFQVTMRRFGRKLDVAGLRRTLPLTPFFFDCLLVDGQDLIDDPFSRRADALAELTGGRSLVPRVLSPGPGAAAAFVDEARRAGHEGVMAKSLDAGYAAGSRGAAWLKIKQATTLDLVVLAAEWGSGRRRGWLSNLHLGARDPVRNGFVMLGKTFKGLTDELLAWQTRRFLGIGDRTRPIHGVRAAGAGGRDRLQRGSGESAVPGRHGAPLRPRQAVSGRQDGGRGGHDRDGAGDPPAGDGARRRFRPSGLTLGSGLTFRLERRQRSTIVQTEDPPFVGHHSGLFVLTD